jgi:hypothetical protein
MTPEQRAARAADLLSNEVLGLALDAIESEVILAWENCPARDKDGQEELWRLYKTSKKFRGVLLGYIQAGKLERALRPKEGPMESAIKMFRGRG